MKLRFAMSTAAALPLALGLAACGSDEPEATGYKPSMPTATPVVPPPPPHRRRSRRPSTSTGSPSSRR